MSEVQGPSISRQDACFCYSPRPFPCHKLPRERFSRSRSKGTCVEAVDHVPGNVTLQGALSGDCLQAPAASSNPVLGISGAGVTLDKSEDFRRREALLVRSGAIAFGNNLVIEGSSSRNVLANGILTLNSSAIENSSGDGIDALSGGIVFLNGGAVQNNSRGVLVEVGFYVDAFGGVVISANTAGHGIDDTGSLSANQPWRS